MSLRKIAVLGHPILRQVAKSVDVAKISSPEIQNLVRDMAETMVEYNGRGLAAPQIHESLQITVILWDFNPKEKASLSILINPVIKTLTQETSSNWEGCLSIPGMRVKVTRPNKISVKAFNAAAEELDFIAEGFMATVIQHECDHLMGKLYVDRMTDFTQFAFDREFLKYWGKEAADSKPE